MSSTNSIVDIRNVILLIVSNKSTIKKRKRIEETGESYGILISVSNSFDFSSNILIMVVLSYKKLVIQRIIISKIFLFRRLLISRVYETLSNTPKIFI
jgi:hypothetical protein